MNAYFAQVVAILSEVIGTSALKACDGFSRLWPSLIVVAGCGLAFYFLSTTVRTVPLGIAYAVWSGLGSALIVGISWQVFKQALFARHLWGCAHHCRVCCFERFLKASGH